MKNGEADYHFIEIMCCPGGCVNGGGMPIQSSSVRNFVDLRKERAKVLYEGRQEPAAEKVSRQPGGEEVLC